MCCCNAEQITNAAPKSAGNRQAGICRTNAEAATPENRHFSNIQCDYFSAPLLTKKRRKVAVLNADKMPSFLLYWRQKQQKQKGSKKWKHF